MKWPAAKGQVNNYADEKKYSKTKSLVNRGLHTTTDNSMHAHVWLCRRAGARKVTSGTVFIQAADDKNAQQLNKIQVYKI
jgi:hypothetical protein